MTLWRTTIPRTSALLIAALLGLRMALPAGAHAAPIRFASGATEGTAMGSRVAPIRFASGTTNGTVIGTRVGEICGDPFTRAGLNNGISPKLLYAIARRESGLRPLALNVDGQAFFPASRDHAITSAIRAKSNVDVGLMQVSYTIWKSRYGLSIADLLNPYRNVETGARILRRLLDFHPLDFLKAVGKYHTGNAEIGRDYSMGVLREWVKAGFDLRICWEEA